ncbi:TPA: hypothetical protein QC285_003312 [Bacillus cereus]|uniref:hypothetical protein n=1 Tax=Bacillus cereus group TaxID=86661 RepID=UPI000BF642E3|nr:MULTISPECIES: hypothetical protein [Bacillus cereus group]PEY15321.1 hypothetical protein CN331_22290 [Bacillus cereus]PFV05375.1 hypothetical protein COL10_25170 [Bacillus cereus]PGV43715.1 hypothetical protein COD74_17610 [Bacillus cereus]RGP99693.1 hypothetical protein D1166_12080 [Bacillus sp. ISO11]HDR8433530.1 hypothetical protein [Bacillus cereus]
MVMKKAELIEKKLKEGLLSINEARKLQGLGPIELDSCKQFFKKLKSKSNQEQEALLTITLTDIDAIPIVHYKGKQIDRKLRVAFDWESKSVDKFDMTYIHVEHVPADNKRLNTEIIQHNHPIVE